MAPLWERRLAATTGSAKAPQVPLPKTNQAVAAAPSGAPWPTGADNLRRSKIR